MKKRILLVDDEPWYAEGYQDMLEGNLNVEVDFCSSVDSAIYQLQNNYYDLLITDLFMPLGRYWTAEIPEDKESLGGDFLIKDIKSGVLDNKINNFAVSKMPIILFTMAASLVNYKPNEKILVIQKMDSDILEIVRTVLF